MNIKKIAILVVVVLGVLALSLTVVGAISSNSNKEVVSSQPKTEKRVKSEQKTISSLVKETFKNAEATKDEKADDKKVDKIVKPKKDSIKNDEKKETKVESKVESKTESKTETQKKAVKKDTVVKTTPKKETKAKTETKSSTTAVKEKKRFVTSDNLNVRKGGGTNHSIIGSVKLGDSVVVIGQSGTWSKIKYGNGNGWVSSNFLADSKPSTKKPSTEKPSSNKKPEAKPDSKPGNVADGLKTIDSNRQLILVTSNGYGTSSAKIQTFEKNSNGKWNQVMSVNGHIGKNGFAASKKEGDGKTPVGKYSIGTGFGQNGNPGTKLSFKDITSDDIWVDDSESKFYNTWQSKKNIAGQYKSAENMNHRLYTNGFVINYNTQGTPYKGSAIFFHVGSGHTLGCVATPESNVKSIMKWIDPAKNPVIIQTPSQDLSKY